MEITLLQGIGIAIMALIVGIDFWFEALFIFRPIIVATLTGTILGDLQTGLMVGGLTELAFAGLTPAGGVQPPNPILAGVMGTVLAYTTGSTPQASMALALPFSFLMQYIILFCYSAFTIFMVKADEAADNADVQSIAKINITTTAIIGCIYAIVVFLCVYIAQEPMKVFVNSLPQWLTHGFEVTGGILPAVGFGMLLKVLLKLEYVTYLIIGFVMASFLTFSNLLPVAAVGFALAMLMYNIGKERSQILSSISTITRKVEDEEDGI
ncbi:MULTISPECIES: PTS galactosamine transporter subunit IIC [Pasteurellaceae]|uniref:PTS galactosamine transporter subunit IIC n=1 Tax=Pasteurella atlantica TaxID=2827233 RepID=A0AAW8CS23_9PAST|nr:PTS galactosamine transporter subunit IIC [Pasteurella atlantica]MBR0574281.1 PTS N-acetylgalactosamine transporter subunit IIC [Pasteurella atlantica]MDP8040185.1 PTS galactosamine transporter subunit IIC [Pasteurella atlantica]MDP8042292.1 PTS galactosamine transporter subunit IIC [Pasteurella atlantica]MDP8044491.1 PTS galactosamine transporter subunit IIC [Pasteurella atlantica]MDP8046497.1 PTS galactosamine transporter subunit IIC [Pasteurella atlantica]